MRETNLDNSYESSDWLHKIVAQNPLNRESNLIDLSRKHIGLVSYFPGLEIKDAPEADWIDDVLIPAVEPIARRKSKKIQEMPITFWVCVRGTARRRAEIFLFVMPAYPGVIIERALSRVLETIKCGMIHAAREPIPEEAVPCLYLFRQKIVRYYSYVDSHDIFYLPCIKWNHSFPEFTMLPISTGQ